MQILCKLQVPFFLKKPMNSITRRGEKKQKVGNDKLNHMIVDVVTFLEVVKAKPSMWMDE
jgi:hypothetical protein